MSIIRSNTHPDMDNKPRSMALKDSSSRTKAVDTWRQKGAERCKEELRQCHFLSKPRRKTLE